MEEKLPYRESHFHALVTATSDVVYIMSADWSVMRQLKGAGLLTDAAEPIVDWKQKYIFNDDLELVEAKIAEAIATKSIFQLEYRVLRADGTLGWTFSRAVPILDNQGHIREWFGAANDVTPRVAVEQELDRQKRLYEAVTSGTPDLVYVFTLDYRFSYANQALLNMWGKIAEDAIGKSLLENGYEPWHAAMHEREIDQIVATGKSIRGEVSFPHAEFGERVYDYILTPVFNDDGRVEAVAGITRDVTDRRMQEIKNLDLSEEMAAVNEELGASNEELNTTNEELQLSQEMLSQAKGNLEQILNMLPASVVVIRGYELIVEMINDSNLAYWKKTKEEVVGRPFLEILPDLADQPFAGQLRRVMETGEVIDVKESPVLFTEEDGSVRETYVDYTYQPLSDLEGKRNGVLVMSFEITDRVLSKRLLEKYADELTIANQELAKSEARFKYLIQEAPVAIGVLQGRTLLIESANAKILEVWGKSRSVVGLPLAEALPELQGQPFLSILDQVYTTGKPFVANEIRAILEHDGEMKEIFFNVVYQPIADSAGVTADILVVAVDVTPQVNARKQLERSEQHFRQLADLVPAKISNTLPNGEVTFFNKQWLDFGSMNFEQMRDFGYFNIMHPEEIKAFQTGLAKAASTGKPYTSEMRFKNADGKYIWHLNIASPVMDNEGNITMWVGSTTDIQSLKEEDERKGEFVSMLSHELKTPVTSIKGHVQLALRALDREEETPLGNKLRPSLARIDQLLVQLTGLIGDMLDLTRIESGRLDLRKVPFYIDELLSEVVEDFRLSHQQHYFQLSLENQIEVVADRDKISQVLINLIANAIKYAPVSDVVDITLIAADTEVLIAVRDYGIGIDEKDQQNIFGRFYRVEGQSELHYSGFGIGLFLASSIMEFHGGNISLESAKGKGSTFTVHLPR